MTAFFTARRLARLPLVLLLLLTSLSGWAQTAFTGTYDFAGVTATTGRTDPTAPPTSPGVTFGAFTSVGASANPNTGGRFSFTEQPLGATNGSDTFTGTGNGLNAGVYYSVTLTPVSGNTFSLTGITFTLQRSGTGIRQYAVRSSADNFAANLPASVSPANANLSVVGTNVFQVLDAVTTAQTGSTITLSGAAYQNLTGPVTFRFYGFNAEAATGTFSIDNVAFTGSYTAITTPTPANLFLSITNPASFPGAVANTTTSTAVFTLRNSGPAPQSVTLTTAAPFSVPAGAVTVPAADGATPGTATVTVTFTPTAPGTFSGTLTAAVAGFQNVVSSEFSATATAPVAPATFPSIAVTQIGSSGTTTLPDAGATPFNFGSQTVSTTSAPVVFTVSNSSTTDDLRITSIDLTGNYALSGAAPTAAAPLIVPKRTGSTDGTATFSLTFTPAGTGARAGTVTIANNSASPSDSYTFDLTGTGTAARPTITSTSLIASQLLTGIPTVVVVEGTGFSTSTDATSLTYSGGTVSELTVSSGTTLRATITATGAGNLTVTTTGGGSSDNLALTVAAPPTAALFEPFERPYQTSYITTPTVLALNSGDVTLNGVLLSSSSAPFSDKRNNSQAARIRPNGYVQFSRPGGVGTVQLLAALFGNTQSAGSPTFVLSYSTDGGGNFTVVPGTPAEGALTATLTPYSYTINQAGAVLLRIANSSAAAGNSPQVNIDDVQLSNFSAPALADLTVNGGNSSQAVPLLISGAYNNITVESTGFLRFGGPVSAAGAVVVSGALDTNCQPLTGPAAFTLNDRAALVICDVAGITQLPSALGAIRVTGARTFSIGASYGYSNSTTAQVTGDGLPATVRNLGSTNPAGLTLSQAVTVTEVARVFRGTLVSNGRLTLRSSQNAAEGTALLADDVSSANSGGSVVGAVNVQRAITRSGDGYRHVAAPISTATVSTLTTNEFSPVVNPAYNTSAEPRAEPVFPTVYSYDQSRVASNVPGTFTAPFEKGFRSPEALGSPLLVGLGYAVQTPQTTFTFSGPVNNGSYALPLTGSGSNDPAAQTGFNFVGNPYPSPLNLSAVSITGAADNGIYVFVSSGKYAGTYGAYLRQGEAGGLSTLPGNSSVVALGQGFFMHVTPPAGGGTATGTLALTNANRVNTFNPANGVFNRSGSSLPALQLTLSDAADTRADQAIIYFADQNAAGVDGKTDVVKLANPGDAVNLSSLAGGQPLAINGLPLLSGGQVVLVPLAASVPQAGSFRFAAEQLANLAPGTTVALRDALSGSRTVLTAGSSYDFSTSSPDLSGRFTLEFSTAGALAGRAQVLAAQVQLYPNPARGSFTLTLPALKSSGRVAATLRNSLGQVVREQAVSGGQLSTISVSGLAAGIYQLSLTLDGTPVVRRVVVQ